MHMRLAGKPFPWPPALNLQTDVFQTSDTIVAVSTAGGPSMRAIVRMSGPSATTIIRKILASESRLRLPTKNYRAVSATLELGEINLPVRLYLMRAPRSYTREDIVEIHTFGAPPLLNALMEQLITLGARPAGPGEFTRRAFLNGRIDLAQAEAVEAVVHARSEAEYRAAHAALAGRLSRRIAQLREQLADLAASVEVALDFSDQEVEIISHAETVQRLKPIRAALAELLAAREEGRIARHAVRVVLYGPANSGKSSLFNAILRRRQAIVSPRPGTTRDTIEATVGCDGLELLLVDTAGLHPPADDVAAAAVSRSREALQSGDLALCVLDATCPPSADTRRALQAAEPKRTLIVLNKRDLGECDASLKKLPPETVDVLSVSATTGDGIAEVLNWLCRCIRRGRVDRSPSELMVTARQARLMHAAAEAMDRILESEAAEQAMDLVAADITEALRTLSDITGSCATEDVLDRIFSNFCIGK